MRNIINQYEQSELHQSPLDLLLSYISLLPLFFRFYALSLLYHLVSISSSFSCRIGFARLDVEWEPVTGCSDRHVMRFSRSLNDSVTRWLRHTLIRSACEIHADDQIRRSPSFHFLALPLKGQSYQFDGKKHFRQQWREILSDRINFLLDIDVMSLSL